MLLFILDINGPMHIVWAPPDILFYVLKDEKLLCHIWMVNISDMTARSCRLCLSDNETCFPVKLVDCPKVMQVSGNKLFIPISDSIYGFGKQLKLVKQLLGLLLIFAFV